MTALSLSALGDRRMPAQPWDDSAFSERILAEHLSQAHDRASRRDSVIDRQVRFIESRLPHEGGQVLDLACGPGLYLHRLARQGHRGRGIDFSPAAIRHARAVADAAGLDCRFDQADLRHADFGTGFDVVLLLFGQINVFPRPTARGLLERAHAALGSGGTLILEPQLSDAVRDTGEGMATWRTLETGLFSTTPHLLLHEPFWDQSSRTTTERWHVVDLGSTTVERHAMSTCAYEPREMGDLLEAIGFEQIEIHSAIDADEDEPAHGLFAVTACRGGGAGGG